MATLHKSLSFAYLDRYASLAINVAASMVLARALTPSDIGLWSATMSLLAYATTVRDFGAGQYLVQAKSLVSDDIKAVWTVQLGVGLALACGVLLAAEPLARFYEDPRMATLMRLVAVTYAINPFGSFTYAWLVREMRFETIAAIRFFATAGGAAVSIVLALDGHGPVSLAWGHLATTAIHGLLSLPVRPRGLPWLPALRGLRSVVSFGSTTTIAQVLQTVIAGAPELLLGKLHSMQAVGFFSRASGLVAMINRLLTDALYNVALSWFSQYRREGKSIAEPFVKATGHVCAAGWSFAVVLGLLACPLIRLLYGSQWDDAVNAARVLSLASACSTPAIFCWTALLASGAYSRILGATVAWAAQAAIFIAVGASGGVDMLSWSMVCVAIVGTGLWLFVSRPVIGFSWGALAWILARGAMVTACATLGPLASVMWFGWRPDSTVAPLAIGGFGAVIGFLVGVRVARHPLETELRRAASSIRSRLAAARGSQ